MIRKNPWPPSLLKTISYLCRDRVPGQLVIQITSRCNAHCPQCGMRDSEWFSLWHKDIGHYAACDFLIGRVPLSKHRLAAASANPRFVKNP